MKSVCFINAHQSGNSIGVPSKPCSLHFIIFGIETHNEASHYSVRQNPIMFFSHQNKPKVKRLIKFMVIAVVIAVSREWLARVKAAFQVMFDRKAGQNE
jgi:hypothetical protein